MVLNLFSRNKKKEGIKDAIVRAYASSLSADRARAIDGLVRLTLKDHKPVYTLEEGNYRSYDHPVEDYEPIGDARLLQRRFEMGPSCHPTPPEVILMQARILEFPEGANALLFGTMDLVKYKSGEYPVYLVTQTAQFCRIKSPEGNPVRVGTYIHSFV